MAIYIIGDVQGCFDELQELLDKIKYKKDKDELWFTGDLVNRGPKSLDVLRYLVDLPKIVTVLGNHDLSLLALAYGGIELSHHTLQDILKASDKEYLLDWLRKRPLLHFDKRTEFLLVHAGIPPKWTLQQSIRYAKEVESILKTDDFPQLLKHLFGNTPDYWQDELVSWDRYRFIVNALTRMRFCTLEGKIDMQYKGSIGSQPSHLLPWFKIPHHKTKNIKIAFGHWAALNGVSDEPNIFALDTGCVWGKQLSALRVDDNRLFSVSCHKRF